MEPKYLKADIFRNGLGVVITDYNIDSIKRSDKFLQITAQIQQDTSILYSKRITYKYGYLNKKGQFQIEPKLVIRHICGWLEKHSDSAIYHFNELGFSRGLAMYQDTSGKFGYINTHGKVVLAPLYEGAKRFREGLAPVGIKQGQIIMIESRSSESFHDFTQALIDFGINNAIYLVGGNAFGWCYDQHGNRIEFGVEQNSLPPQTSYIIWRSR